MVVLVALPHRASIRDLNKMRVPHDMALVDKKFAIAS